MTKAAELAKMGEVITNSKISGRRNLVLNGSMQVAQRGTSATVASYGTVDRFTFPFDGSNSITQSQGTLSSSDSPYADGFRHYARNTNTNTSSGTGTYAGIKTIIESQDMAQSGWEYTSTSSTVTIQFWARSSVAGTYYMNLRSDDTTAKNFTIPVALTADTWKKITATVIGNSGLVFNNDNGAGLSMIMWMHLGTDYTTSGHTTNAWQTNSGSDQAPDYSIDWRNTSAATFDLTGIQLEVGSVATPFEHRSFGEERDLCYRYYVKYHAGGSGTFSRIALGYMRTTTNLRALFTFPREMRSTPTLDDDNAGNYHVEDASGNSDVDATVASISQGGFQTCLINFTTGSITNNEPAHVGINNSTDALLGLGFDAEL